MVWHCCLVPLLRGLGLGSTDVLGSENVTVWPTTDRIVSDPQGLLLAHVLYSP